MFKTLTQTSAGGVVFRIRGRAISVVLIAANREEVRWSLPKGQLEPEETPAQAALREVREETGIEAELSEFIDRIEYWYIGQQGKERVRFHKTVHFYLMKALGGSLSDHDHEVMAARWWPIDKAIANAAYRGEQAVLSRAKQIILESSGAE